MLKIFGSQLLAYLYTFNQVTLVYLYQQLRWLRFNSKSTIEAIGEAGETSFTRITLTTYSNWKALIFGAR